MERFEICKTAVYSVRCLAGKPIPTVIVAFLVVHHFQDTIKELAANVKYNCLTTFVINGKPACVCPIMVFNRQCCSAKPYAEMTITDSTFELTKVGAVENGTAVVEGKKVSVTRIWEYCECLCSYVVSSVIVFDCAEAPKAEEKKEEKKEEEEEEEDLFGDDDDDEDDEAAAAMEAKIRAEAEKKKAEKEANKKVEKSLMVINVKPYDEETDLKALFKKIQETEVKGCKWSETCNILPLAYGISYIQLSCVIEDDVCCEDDVIEAITQFEDEVQSTEVASFNKFS